MEVTKWLKPSISVSQIGDSASVQAATRVNAEQSSKRAAQAWAKTGTGSTPEKRQGLPGHSIAWDVCYGAHNGLKSDIAALPKSANSGSDRSCSIKQNEAQQNAVAGF
jgi:hypothetical protein